MRRVVAVVGLVANLAIGCTPDSRHDRPGRGPALVGGPGRGGPDGSTTLAEGSAGEASIAPCPAFDLSSTLRLAPAAPGQSYTRCATLGPEADWRVALSRDASRLAAKTSAGTVRLIATDIWRDVAQLAAPLGRLDAMAFSPDGSLLVTLSAEMGLVTLWRSADGTMIRSFAGPPASTIDGTAAALAFSSDGSRLATSLGLVIDLGTGATTDWHTGRPAGTSLAVNPENLGTGVSIPLLRFVADDSRLLVRTDYQVGNSPPSTRLELRDPSTGGSVVLFEMYRRALRGFAVSRDGKLIALDATREVMVAELIPGLRVVDAATGQDLAVNNGSFATVLGFSPGGELLYLHDEATLQSFSTVNLRRLTEVPWRADFLGISPAGFVVGAAGGSTTWTDASSGAVVRGTPFALTSVTWSADGRHGAGAGDSGSLFHLWREADGSDLCSLPSNGYPAPQLGTLGTMPGPSGTLVTGDGSISISQQPVLHTHGADWSALVVTSGTGGKVLRVFGAASPPRDVAVAQPGGERLFTVEGQDVAVWCK